MAHVARSIEVDAAVDDIHQQWLRYEALPHSEVHGVVGRARWRAEVLTFEPTGAGTRITLKIEYDPAGGDEGLSARIEGALRGFRSFFERRRVGAADAVLA